MITLDQLPAGHPGHAFLTGSTTWFAVQADPRFSYGLRIPDGHGDPTLAIAQRFLGNLIDGARS